MSTLISNVASLPGSNLSMLVLLAKATLILIAALGITLAMQRASAGARHLVWLVSLSTLLLVPALSAWAPIRFAILPASPVTSPEAAPSMSTASSSTTLGNVTSTAQVLRDENDDARLKTAWALGQIGDAAAIPAIREALQRETSSEVRRALIRALMRSGERSQATLTELLNSGDPQVREAAVRGLAGNNSFNPWPWPWPRPRPIP